MRKTESTKSITKDVRISTTKKAYQVILKMILEANTDIEIQIMITRCIMHVLKEENEIKTRKIITLLIRNRLTAFKLICPWDGELHRSSVCNRKFYEMFPELKSKLESESNAYEESIK